MHEISKTLWHVSKIDNQKISDLAKKYGGSGIYYTEVFKRYLQTEYNITIEDYLINYCNEAQPICACGICNEKTNITIKNSNFRWREFKCGRNKGIIKWSEWAKDGRKGKNNPMYGKDTWNKGQTKETNEKVRLISERGKGRKTSDGTKKKQSESAKRRLIHGHTGIPHSEETKQKLRENTLRLIKLGVFKQNNTGCFCEMRNILIKNEILFEEEKIVNYWAFDFFLIDHNIYIEVDGDYWHSNPKFYPDGPQSKTQKINYARDISKNNFCKKNNLKLIRYWEYDILNNKDYIECNLKTLLGLKK